jgi:hypothetical protein
VYATDAKRLYVGTGAINGVYGLVPVANVADTQVAPSINLTYTGTLYRSLTLEIAPPMILTLDYNSANSTWGQVVTSASNQLFTAPLDALNSFFNEFIGLRNLIYEEPISFNGLQTLSFGLTGVGVGYIAGDIVFSGASYLKSLGFGTGVVYCGGNVTYQNLSGNVSSGYIGLPIPGYINGNLTINNCARARIVNFGSFPITSGNAPKMYIRGSVTITNNPNLIGLNTFSATNQVGGNVILTNNALNLNSVNSVLAGLAALDGTGDTFLFSNCTIDLSGGTNAAPTNTSAITTLQSRGCTVNHN